MCHDPVARERTEVPVRSERKRQSSEPGCVDDDAGNETTDCLGFTRTPVQAEPRERRRDEFKVAKMVVGPSQGRRYALRTCDASL
jgi:hypothetical protein